MIEVKLWDYINPFSKQALADLFDPSVKLSSLRISELLAIDKDIEKHAKTFDEVRIRKIKELNVLDENNQEIPENLPAFQDAMMPLAESIIKLPIEKITAEEIKDFKLPARTGVQLKWLIDFPEVTFPEN